MTLASTVPGVRRASGGSAMAVGTLVNRFVVLQKVGEGASAEVFEAHDPDLDRSVALKILRASVGEGSRLEREARALAKLSHPNVVSVYEVGVHRQRVFMALELVRGQTLRQWRVGRPAGEVVEAFLQAGRGLAAAHRAGLVHRDFKPDNVIVGDDGRVRVADFGLARAPVVDETPADGRRVASEAIHLTVTSDAELVGTPAYAAPEAYGPQRSYEATADVYSFCCALYEALAGHLPFCDVPPSELHAAKLGGVGTSSPPRGVPRWLWRVVLQGLSPSPSDRQADLDVVVAQVERGRRRRRRLIVVAGLVGVGLASLGVSWGVDAAARMACERTPEALEPVWTADARESARRRFAGLAPDTQLRWERLDHGLTDYERAIATQWTQSCSSARVEAITTEPVLQRSLECLEDRADALASLVEVLSTADAAIVERSGDAVASLPSVEDCGEEALLPFLGTHHRSEDSRALRARLRRIVQRMGAAGSEQALAELRALSEDAAAASNPGLRADIELQMSRFSEGTVSIEEAKAHAHQAILLARGANAPLTEALAWTQLAGLQRNFAGDLEQAWASTEHAAAALRTVGEHPPTRAHIELERATLHASGGNCEAAMERAGSVLSLLESRPHEGLAILARHTMAICDCRAGRYDAGLSRIDAAVEAHRRRGTYASQNVGALLQTRARCLGDAGRDEEALEAFAEAEAALAEVVPPEHRHRVVVQLNWAVALQDLGRHEAAVEHAARAVERADAGLGPKELMRATTRFVHAISLRALGRLEPAARRLREGLEFLDAHHPEHFDQSAIHRNMLADVLAEAGHHEAALEQYTRVVEMTRGRTELSATFEAASAGISRLEAKGR